MELLVATSLLGLTTYAMFYGFFQLEHYKNFIGPLFAIAFWFNLTWWFYHISKKVFSITIALDLGHVLEGMKTVF